MRAVLDAALQEQQRKESLRVQFADGARDLASWGATHWPPLRTTTLPEQLEAAEAYAASALDSNDASVCARQARGGAMFAPREKPDSSGPAVRSRRLTGKSIVSGAVREPRLAPRVLRRFLW